MLFVILAVAASFALNIHTKIYLYFAYKFICLLPKVYLDQSFANAKNFTKKYFPD